MRGWAAASLGGAIAAIFITTSLAIVLDGAAPALKIALDVPYSRLHDFPLAGVHPFGIDVFCLGETWPCAVQNFITCSRRRSCGMAGLAAFVGLIYEYPFTLPWEVGQWRLALTFAIAGFAFGAVRESHYKRRNN